MRIAPILTLVVLAAGAAAGYAYWQQQATRVPPGLARGEARIVFDSAPEYVIPATVAFVAAEAGRDVSGAVDAFREICAVGLYRGAGIDVVWRDLAIMAGLGDIFLAIALARFRTMLARQA